MVRRVTIALFLLFSTAAAPQRLSAQIGGPLQPPTTGGLPVLLQELRMLGHNKRVLMIGAHPDDEDTQLLVMFTRREGAEAAYLSLTRGEGGQNLIGNELGEALGILRTEELLAARNIDGAQQFFTRAYDFGFSKTIDDAWAHWPRDSVLKDVVRIVRRFRPQVIVSVFSGTPRDGHGQHQVAGWAAQEAYRVAGDPTRFPELATEEGLQPWTPTKIYIDAWFNPAAATLTLDGGEVEKLSGKTYHQLAMAARSLHRSQDMGNLQEFGPSPSRLMFKAVRSGTADVGDGWAGFWSGVDTVLKAPPEHFAALTEARAAAGRDPVAVRAALARAARNQGELNGSASSDYYGHIANAARVVSWVFFDGVADRARIAPGESLSVRLLVRNVGRSPVDLGTVYLVGIDGQMGGRLLPDSLLPGAALDVAVPMVVRPAVGPSTPYYLRRPRVGDLYAWPPAERSGHYDTPFADWMGEPRGTDGLVARVVNDELLAAEVSERVRDQAFGEVRHPVVIVPRVSVKLTPGVAVVRTGASGEARTVSADVELESGLTSAVGGTVTIEVPNGWPRPTPVSFQLNGLGAITHASIRVTVPAGTAEGQYPIRAVATDAAGQRYTIGAFTIDYPHIRSRQYTKPAEARIEVMDLTPPPVRNVAYVRGAADKVPEALNAAGLHVTLLDSVALGTSDLSTYDAIVIGPRAYEVDSALVRNNQRLNDYARAGGRVVVQYQQQVYLDGSFAPYSLGGNSRITDERSPVTMLGATPSQSALAPVFRTPNAIGQDDWDGWIQDRALYCPTTWGPEFHPLLAMSDPGEAPIRGCLLESAVGRGSYVYTGIAFFRELPAGVPGAYRLFFNLLGGRVTP